MCLRKGTNFQSHSSYDSRMILNNKNERIVSNDYENYDDLANYNEFGTKNNRDSVKLTIICVMTIMIMIGMLVVISAGIYLFASEQKNLKGFNIVLNSFNETEVIYMIKLVKSATNGFKALNLTQAETDVEFKNIAIAMSSIGNVSNISHFLRDISYLVNTACKIFKC